MKEYHVYKIVDKRNKILYIGETSNIKLRLHVHTNIQGKFYKRNDIKLIIIKSFDNKKDAFNYQIKLQKKYRFETDLDKLKNSAKKGSQIKMERFRENGMYRRKINCYNYFTKQFICQFESTRKAERDLNVKNIYKVLNGTAKHTKGYYFEYA